MRVHGVDWYHHLPAHVKGILETLRKAGHEAYLVGGCVRDLWLGLAPKDFDLASGATPDEVEKLFPRTEGVGRAFGVMLVVTENGPVEVARFRADAEYEDGRRPTGVAFSSPEEDAKRRDFTINALFYDPAKGEVIDYVGGINDLERKRIRCVGDPELRFQEDSLRMLRAARFHAQLAPAGFLLDEALVRAVQGAAPRLSLVSRERVTQELEKILRSEDPGTGLLDLVILGLWEPVFGTPPPPASLYADFGVLGEAFRSLAGAAPGPALFFAAAAAWIPGLRGEERFVLPRECKAALRKVPTLQERLRGYGPLDRAGKKRLLAEPYVLEAIAILRVRGDEALLDLLDEALADRERWTVAGSLNPPPLVSGDDLLALGLKPGPRIKEVLDAVRAAQLGEELDGREEALALARRML